MMGYEIAWTGAEGVFTLLGQHLFYSALALIVALLIAVPIGMYVGHTGHGEVLIAGVANLLRALPTLGLLVLLVIVLSPVIRNNSVYLIPSLIVLILLAVPPIMTSTYAGIKAIEAEVVDAAYGMGMTKMQVLWQIQFPCALPLILSGIRAGVLQIVSTATVAAYVSLGGLGRLIIDGQAANNYGEMAFGALLVAILAFVLDLLFVALTRMCVSPGLRRSTIKVKKQAA